MGHSTAVLRGRVAIGWVAVALALTGCGSNFNAESQQLYQPAVGMTNRDGEVYAVDTLVVTDGHGNGTVVSALINQARQTDTLTAVTAATDEGAQLKVGQLPANGLRLPSGQSVQLANSGAVRVSGSSLAAGSVLRMTFTFQHAQPVRLYVPVVSDSPTYRDVPVGRA